MELRFNDPELKFAGAAVKFLPSGKVLVILEGMGVHYTLHPGHDSGVIDIHKTNEHLPERDPARYETLVTQKAVPEQQLATQKALVEQDVADGYVSAESALHEYGLQQAAGRAAE